MSVQQETTSTIEMPGAPDVPGLRFRGFRGEADYRHMVAVIEGSKEEDKHDNVTTVEEVANSYGHLTNCDPYTDMLFAEIGGQVVAYSRVTWWEELAGDLVYLSIGFLLPQWRRKGIGRAMLRYNEMRLRQIAAGHSADKPHYFENFASEAQVGKIALLDSEGYQPNAYFADMVRPNLEDIPAVPLPEGLEVRPVEPEHYRAIWEADVEAFRDHWGYSPPVDPEKAYDEWLNEPTVFQPELWKVGWDGDQVAGQVRSFINEKENEEFGRQRGYTEFISVRRPWRRRGLARRLIAQSLYALKDRGMSEAALSVHTDNPLGAYRLYESLGFEVVKRSFAYRKPLD